MINETAISSDLTLRQLIRVLNRRRLIIFVSIVICIVLSILASVFTTRRYQATCLVQLQKSSADGLNLGSMAGAAGGASDALSSNIDLQTQSQILQSDEIQLRVIQMENLEQNLDFKPKFSLIGWAMHLFERASPADTVDGASQRREQMLTIFRSREQVQIVSGTRIIAVSFVDRNPKVAASVANDLVHELSEYTFQTKFQATNEASIWLERQLGDLRKQSTDLQAKVSDLQKQTGLYGVGGTDTQGKSAIYSPILDRFQQSNAALAQAQSSVLLKGAIARVAQSGDADQISQLSGTMSSSSAGVQSSLALIESLRSQETTLQQQIGKDATVFGEAYPRLIEERAALAKVQTSLKEEIGRIAERAQNDYKIAQDTENGLQRRFEQDKDAAGKLNDRTIEYALLAKEADQSQLLYNDLLRHLHEAGILEGLRSSNLSIVSAALPPASPKTPNVKLYLMAGPLIGLFLGLSAAFLFDAIDNKVRGPEEIETEEIPLLGILPSFVSEGGPAKSGEPFGKSKPKPIFLAEPASPYSEALRALRSNLMIARGGNPPQVLLVTSGSPGEGKSTLTLNLAVALAQLQKNVLLIELDLRRPILAVRLGLSSSSEGMSAILSDSDRPIVYESFPDQPYLKVIPAGLRPPFPGELLASPRLDELLTMWRKQFDFILIDTPPVLPVADSQSLVEKADFTIMVVRSDRTSRIALKRAHRILTSHQIDHSNGIAAVLNGLSFRSASYYAYYGYRGDYDYSEKVPNGRS